MRHFACVLVLLIGCAESSIGLFEDGGGADTRADDGGGADTRADDGGSTDVQTSDSAGCAPLPVPECFVMEGAACRLGSDPMSIIDANGCVTYRCPDSEVSECTCPTSAPPRACRGIDASSGACEETREIPSEVDLCGLECPEGTELGSCPECEYDVQCTLGFSECCGACVDDATVVGRSFEREDDFLTTCEACVCGEDGSARFERALPVCNAEGTCVAWPFDRTCSDPEECELVHTMGVDERCGTLIALPHAEVRRLIERYDSDSMCGLEANAIATCEAGVCMVDRTML